MGYAVQHDITLETEVCCTCGVVFSFPAYLMKKRREDGDNFYCPNGHAQRYSQTEAQRLRRMLDEANRRNTELAQQVLDTQMAEQKTAKELRRLRTRSQAGVCTCCNRTFQNLQRHMATKHSSKS